MLDEPEPDDEEEEEADDDEEDDDAEDEAVAFESLESFDSEDEPEADFDVGVELDDALRLSLR